MSYLEILAQAWQTHERPKPSTAPTVISLFAGCGGSSLGYSMAGYRELLAVEWNDNAVKTLQRNFPELPIYHGDLTKLTVEECLALTKLAPGELDVLDGSPPCQGFSTAGKRNFNDNRNQLFQEYVRLLTGLQPKVFVMENVSGLIKGKMKLIFADILRSLKSAGYQVTARLMNTQYFQVPQRRERLIFMGVRNDINSSPTHPKAMSRPMTMVEAIGDLPHYPIPEKDHSWIDESPQGKNTKTWWLAAKAKQGEYYAGHQKRTVWHQPFPTITKPSDDTMNLKPYLRSSNCHPLYTRTFSTRELARGASFPDAFQFIDGQGAHRIGNSVPPLFMKAIAEHIRTNVLHPH